ncbi:bifunctional diguanylate cyclase/phosphodiesterase [Microaerobacter geothermalis]|uniref:putative bifunctional diguanylate cyclase/phosphodiesterase n=1 Tax=Microaerobacter geothermalis TaxID=674972 RepID=UPI001F247683|nr:bifunctional diguanylate cyclase/phosphodiesterase [Microaerobacter geothermalis]MCF6094373.1 bifunctional diguanylate cyclase/phosphodiesterase [Microaerobacter geothermalis]
MRFSNGVLDLFEELTSRTEKLDLTNMKEIIGRLTQEYVDRFQALLEQAGQEVNEAELRETVSDLLELFSGNQDKELFKRRIEFGRKLSATEIPLEQLIKIYGSLFERLCDELTFAYQFSKKELQSLKYGAKTLFIDFGLQFWGYEGEKFNNLRVLSTVDVKTGLMSRRKFEEKLHQAIEFAKNTKTEFSLYCIDMDNLRFINDVFGYIIGDIVLKNVADHLLESLPDLFAVARIGDDEFGVILMNTGPVEALEKAQVICKSIAEMEIKPLGDEGIFVTSSIGVASYPHHGQALDDIMLAADVACITSKRKGRNRAQLVDPTDENINPTVVHERILVLREALSSKDHIVPFYQPIVDLETGEPMAYEVLARVKRGEKFLSAGLFVDAAEKSGLMKEIGKRVIEQAMKEKNSSWAKDKLFFINFSMREVENRETIGFLVDLFNRYGINPEEIVAEITERETVRDINAVHTFAKELSDLRVRMAVDDFGSGFSSFLYLRYFDCYFAKIEGSLVRDITRSGRSRMIVENMAKLLQRLSIEVVAEFVENREIARILKNAGIRYGQGYYLGKPSPCPGNGS